MRIGDIGILLAIFAGSMFGQGLDRSNVATILDFENGAAGRFPTGWGGTATGITADDKAPYSGRLSGRIERTATNTEFSALSAVLPADFTAGVIEWRGAIRTEDVRDFAALWVRLDGAAGQVLSFASLQTGTPPKGTTDWQEYSIRIAGSASGRQLVFGFLLGGPGRAWVDKLELIADGKPVALAPSRVITPTALDTDTEFSAGSRVALESISEVQAANLATLGKVWGFVKYHHPAVTNGKRHWDFDLFRVMPRVLAASSAAEGNQAIGEWVAGLGPVVACSACATLSEDGLDLAPDIAWIQDSGKLGEPLSQLLQDIYRNRPTESQLFVQAFPNVGNPRLDQELNYASLRFPDAGYQLLALFRFWNMMQYFNPNRAIMNGYENRVTASSYWNGVLEESIPAFALAKDKLAYRQELLKFIVKINDTHANLWSGLAARPPMGDCQVPVDIRFIEGRPVVIRTTAKTDTASGSLLIGDVILRLDGEAVDGLVEQWRPFYPASNEPTRLRDIGNNMMRGACGAFAVTVEREGVETELSGARMPPSAIDLSRTFVHDLPGTAFQKPQGDIAYVKISDARKADAANYGQWAEGTAGMIIDLRNYPSDFPLFEIGGMLVEAPTEFARFTQVDLMNPGAFYFRTGAGLSPIAPRYPGKVVILVDEVTQSSAEYHAMAFRAAGGIVMGSTTAGADGNVSTIPLPGGDYSMISGIGIYYPDKGPTQRVGIVPDIEVKPTIAGIRAGKDELIDEAIRWIRGAGSK